MARNIGSRYTAQKVLGRGASGTVWRGEGPEGPVAIKLLREDLATDQELVARFVQERTALTSLEHRNIVGVHELVVDGADLALVMDLVEGEDLRARLEREQVFEPSLAVAIVADVADALAAAHAEGLIHRDVKPENVLLDERDGELTARLTDFGIARLVDSPRRTRATRIIGTPDYLAPEIIEGCRPTAAVDVYSLGTVCYELLTGWTPFGYGHPGAVLRRHVTEAVPGIPGLPEPLAVVLSSCLSKAPAARLSAVEMADALRELLPSLAGMPAFDVPDPHADEAEEYAEPTPARRSPARRRPTPAQSAEAADSADSAAPAALSEGDEPGALAEPAGSSGGGSADAPGHGDPAEFGRGGERRTPASGAPAASPRSARPAPDRRPRTGDAGVVPLVPAAADGFIQRVEAGAYSRQTHLSLRRPDPAELAKAGVARGNARRRRVALVGVAALAALLLAGGGYLLVASLGHGGNAAAQPVGAATRIPDPGRSGGPTATASASPDPNSSRALSWSPPSPLPAAPDTLTGGVQAAAMPGGKVYAFARGGAGDLWYIGYDGDQYSGWQRLTGLRTLFEPAVVGSRDRLDLFAVGQADQALWQRTFTGGVWGHWIRLGSGVKLTQAPAAAVSRSGRIDVLARSAADNLVAGAVDGGRWQDFTPVTAAGRITAAPALAAGDGSLDAFVARAGDGALLRISYSGGMWQHALPVGGVTYSRPAAARLTDGRLLVVSRASSGRLQAHTLVGASWQLTDLAVDTPAAPGVAAAGDRAEVFARGYGAKVDRASGS